MPTLLEVEEKENRERLLSAGGHFSQLEKKEGEDALVSSAGEEGWSSKEGRGVKEGREGQEEGERHPFATDGEGKGGEGRREETSEVRERREGRVEFLREEGDATQGPTSSTPASKSSESLPQMRSSDSFHELLGTGSDFDRYSVTSIASLPEGLFEGYVRHKDGSLLAIIFQVSGEGEGERGGGRNDELEIEKENDNECVYCAYMYYDLA